MTTYRALARELFRLLATQGVIESVAAGIAVAVALTYLDSWPLAFILVAAICSARPVWRWFKR
jgi:hypothetical protein